MAIVVPKEMGKTLLLQYIIGQVEAGHPVLHLYSAINPAGSPTADTALSDLTECAIPGYDAVTLVAGDWTLSQGVSGATIASPRTTFSFTTSGHVDGYYVTDTAGQLLWLSRLENRNGDYQPFDPPDDGGFLVVQPELSL